MQNNRTTIAQFLKQKRAENGWSQRELARRLNCPQATVQMWEAEKTRPDILSTEKIANLFSMPLSELFKSLESGDIVIENKSCNMKDIMDALKSLPTAEVAKINVAAAKRLAQAC